MDKYHVGEWMKVQIMSDVGEEFIYYGNLWQDF